MPTLAHSINLLVLTALFFLLFLTKSTRAYFVIEQPAKSTTWANGSPYPASWVKGLQDGVDAFDIELMRLHEDGLYLVAMDVPSAVNALNIVLQDVPDGDDYFLLCLNSTHGIAYAISDRFSVVNSSFPNPSPVSSAPTVTISGTPNPLKLFATTLGPAFNGVQKLLPVDVLGVWGVLIMMGTVLLSGSLTLW